MTTVFDVSQQIQQWYPVALAEGWDAIGLVAGRPESTVESILVTVDVTESTVREARERGANLILAPRAASFMTSSRTTSRFLSPIPMPIPA